MGRRIYQPHFTGFLLPEQNEQYSSPSAKDNHVGGVNSSMRIDLNKCSYIGYGIDCYGKFKDLPHLCTVNQIGIKYSQDDSSSMVMRTPDKEA